MMAAESKTQTAQDRFINAMRELFAREPDENKRWDAVPELLKDLLADPEVRAASQKWPVPSQVLAAEPSGHRAGNLLFYEDPDYGFVINGQIHEAGRRPAEPTAAHDHGQ